MSFENPIYKDDIFAGEPPLVGDTNVVVLDVHVDLADNIATAEAVLELALRYRYGKISEQELLEALHLLADSGASIKVLSAIDVSRLDNKIRGSEQLVAKSEAISEAEAELTANELSIYDLESKKKSTNEDLKPCFAVEKALLIRDRLTIGELRAELLALLDETTVILEELKVSFWQKEDALVEWETHNSDLKDASGAAIQGRSWEKFAEVKALKDALLAAKTEFGDLAKPASVVQGIANKSTYEMISPAMKDQILALTAIVATYAKAMDERLATELSDEITEAYDTYKQRFQKKESLKQELETETDTLKKGISRILTTISNRAEKYIVSQQGTHTN